MHHAGITRDSEPVACQSGTTEGSVAMLEHEPVYWEHPRHARKRPRLMEDVGQIDAEPPIIDSSTSIISAARSSDDSLTSPSFALRMDSMMREAPEMFSEVKRLKEETEMLKKILRDNIRATSEESRRLEARLELLEQSSHSIEKECKTEPRRPRYYFDTKPESLHHAEDAIGPAKEESKCLLQSETSSGALMDKLEIPVRDPVLRSKITKLLGEIYDIVRADFIAPAPPAKHEHHITGEKATEPITLSSQPRLVEPSEPSSSASSRSMSLSSAPPNSSRHTTPFVESVSPEPKSPPAKQFQTPVKISSKPLSVKGPPLHPVFIHPPFTAFPDSHLHPEGLTYDLMAENAEWFLDPVDFTSTSSTAPDAVSYPRKLEPSTSMVMLGMTDSNGQRQRGQCRLRCTFCRKIYTGEDAESTWRNHVLEQHSIVLANDRHDNESFQVRNTNEIILCDSRISIPALGSGSSAVTDPAGSLELQPGPASQHSPAGVQLPLSWHSYFPTPSGLERANMPAGRLP